MSVWLCIPSKRPPEEAEPVLSRWRERGYRIALWRDEVEYPSGIADYVHVGEYRGYPHAVNALAHNVLRDDPYCDWIVAAGDDTLPDPNKSAEEIASECWQYYSQMLPPPFVKGYFGRHTFGVMQPTGDPWSDRQGRIIERIAGSPWLGREWCLRANKGKGPLWPGFFHCWADETLQIVAQKLGVFWQRPDLSHLHNHWARPRASCPTCRTEGIWQRVEGHRGAYLCPKCEKEFLGERIGQATNMKAFLAKAYSPEQTTLDKREFDRLKAGGFEECLPL